MGWGRTLLLGDIGNRLDIEDTERAIGSLKQRLSAAVRKDMTQDEFLHDLRRENAELKLYLASVIRMLVSKGMITEEELSAVVDAVDAEDGRLDGRYEGTVS